MSLIIAMCFFSLVMSISPGPVNLITLSIGTNNGFRKAVPFVSGATFGFTFLLFLIGIGLGEVADRIPYLMDFLSFLGVGLIGFLGYKIASSVSKIEIAEEEIPNFKQGVLLQWLNPKAWAACFAGISAFGAGESMSILLMFVAIYFTICFFGIGGWAFFGEKISTLIRTPKSVRAFNRIMGFGLIAIAIYLLYSHLNT